MQIRFDESKERKRSRLADLIVFSCAIVAYSIALFQRTMPASLAPYLLSDFNISWADYAYFSSIYLIAYLVTQIPAGLLVDRYGSMRIILLSLFLSCTGIGLLVFCRNYYEALLARALTALGDAFIFSVLIKLAATLFPQRQFALVMSLVQLAGSLGVVLSTSPLRYVLSTQGWRQVLNGVFWCIILIAIPLFIIARRWSVQIMSSVSDQNSMSTRFEINLAAYLSKFLPTLVGYAAFYFIYIFMFSAWGGRYLSNTMFLSSTEVATSLLAGTIGLSIGGLLSGWVLFSQGNPDRVSRQATYILIVSICALLFLNQEVFTVTACVFVIGLSLGALSNSITATVRERCSFSRLSLVSAVHAVFGSLINAVFFLILTTSLIIPSTLLLFASFWKPVSSHKVN